MLFNSYEFIFLFLPVAVGGYFFFGRFGIRASNAFLALASFFFYGWWDVRYLPLLLGSIVGNYAFAGGILAARADGRSRAAKAWFLLGLAANLGVLCCYKYLDFFLKNIDALTGADIPLLHLVLPLGISFFTITQVLYLYDCYEGVAKDHDFVRYALFVSFFPHLMAGPILYHRQMMQQLADERLHRPQWECLARGSALFVIGLAKKVLIADSFIQYVNPAFLHPGELTFLGSWLVMACYLCQLYFDFSGYSDMALGLARMMGIAIPVNFNAPYRAASLITFWQRWHISLTNALTACVYMPIVRRFHRPTFAVTTGAATFTLFLVGIWHGAGWSFVIFAAMHAAGIAVNHLWRQKKLPMPRPLGHILTLLWVTLAMVFFRAGSARDALDVLAAMFGLHGFAWPATIVAAAERLGCALDWQPVLYLFPKKVFLLAVLLIALAPPAHQLVKRGRPAWPVFLAIAALFLCTVLQLGAATDFLYFQF